MKRLLATLLVMVVTLAAVEGLVSLSSNRSLVRQAFQLASRDGTDPDLFAAPIGGGAAAKGFGDEERRELAATNTGMYRRHPDPLVAFSLRPNSTTLIHEGELVSDELGLRARPNGPIPEDALRIAILGASIPFGFGVDNDETLAAQLEEILAEVRGPDARPVACLTVALGRWGHMNSAHFLLDHWDELRPDIVVYLPFGNELSDSDLVDETGHRHAWPDVSSDDPWQQVNSTRNQLVINRIVERIANRTTDVTLEDLGPVALTSDISNESSRRYDLNLRSIQRVHERLEASDGKLVVLRYREDVHAWILAERLASAGLKFPVVPLFKVVDPSFTLGFDPHPNAETHRTFAIWTAQAMLQAGWVDRGADNPLPEVPAAHEKARSQITPWRRVSDRAMAARNHVRSQLQPVVDFRTGRGIRQLYGGLSPFGNAGTRLLVMLAAEGETLDCALAPLPDRPDAYPMEVFVRIDGEVAGTMTVTSDGPAEASFPLPADLDPARALEVQLIPERWVVVTREDVSEVASFMPLRIASESEVEGE